MSSLQDTNFDKIIKGFELPKVNIKMPTILSKDLKSKILGQEWSFGYNCYEVGHCWTPSCTDAALEISVAAGLRVVPLYTALYSFTQLAIQRRYDLDATLETVKSIARSSFFIFFHAYNGALIGCGLRNATGRFYYRVLVCTPALLSCYLSILIEKPARRQALAFYLINLASEIVFRMMVTKGYFTPIRNGETLLFASSLAAWYYFLKVHGFGHDPVSFAVKILIGRDEAKSRSRIGSGNAYDKVEGAPTGAIKTYNSDNNMDVIAATKQTRTKSRRNNNIAIELAKQWLEMGSSAVDAIGHKYLNGKHDTCPHQEATCLRYVIGPVPSRFLLGYAIQCGFRLASRPLDLFSKPQKTISETLLSRSSLKFGLFLVTLVSSGRLTSCLLRRYSNSNEAAWHGGVSGFVAGLSMLLAPRSSLSMYVMWKAVEQYYLKAAELGKVMYFQFTVATLYSISAATILYAFALEPRFVRPSYMQFLDRLSDHRLHQLNRMVLDVFGTGASVGYEDYFPDLDPKYMSNQFKELIFNWMIQPYE